MPNRLDYFSKTSEECHAKYKKPCDYAVSRAIDSESIALAFLCIFQNFLEIILKLE